MVWSLLLLVVSVTISLVLIELILWVFGFSYRLYPEKIEFGWPDPEMIQTQYQVDRDLFWVTQGYDQRLQQAKIDMPEIVFMGCSCTEMGGYDQLLLGLVADKIPGREISGLNVGVGGWTSYQGLRQLQRDILPLRPRIITIYYGWNDHWVGFGIEDKEVATIRRSSLFHLDNLRVVQLVTRLQVFLRQPARFPKRRVSVDDFRHNLREMIRLARGHGITPVLLTAPTSHEKGREPQELKERFLPNPADLIPLHQRYVEVVRELAREEEVAILDLAQIFDNFPRSEVEEKYFMRDGIHLSYEGNEIIAELLYDFLSRQELL